MQWFREGKWNGTDWFTDSINKNDPNNNMVLGVTGGSDSVRYSFSFSKSYQEGTLGVPKPTYYDRTTVRANTDFTVLRKNNRDVIKLGENVVVSITDSRGMSTSGRGSDVSNLLTKTPLLPAYDLDGSIYTYDKQVRDAWDARDNEVNLLQEREMKESEGKRRKGRARPGQCLPGGVTHPGSPAPHCVRFPRQQQFLPFLYSGVSADRV